jgi:hypothetical protein
MPIQAPATKAESAPVPITSGYIVWLAKVA